MSLNKNIPDNERDKALAEAEAEVVKAEKAFKKLRTTRRLKNYLRARANRDKLKIELFNKSEN